MTGYERAGYGEFYCVVCADDEIGSHNEDYHSYDNRFHNTANYYTSETVAKNNARADALMRKLRRFAVENWKQEIDWNDEYQEKWNIYYNYSDGKLDIIFSYTIRHFGQIYFDTKETVKKAIEQFYDELIWYFTEYRDSCGLPEPKEQEEPEIQKFSTDELLEELKRRMENAEQNEKENK